MCHLIVAFLVGEKNAGLAKPKYLAVLIAFVFAVSMFNPISANAVTAQDDCESIMKSALAGDITAVFEIADDHVFEVGAYGIRTMSASGSMSSFDMTTEEAEGFVAGFSRNKIIRVSEGMVTVDDGDQCNLQALPDGGIAISITRGDMMSVNQGKLEGVIQGNTLTAEVEVSMNTLVNGIGNGFAAGGSFTVSICELPADQWPPVPPINVAATELDDHSINVSWEDPNSTDVVAEYDIYRQAGYFSDGNDYEKITTVTGCTSWVDTSEVAKTEMGMLTYYIVARGYNGKESIISDLGDVDVIDLLDRATGWSW